MLRKITGIALIAGVAALGPVAAQDASRYTMERTDDGFVRMDRDTGEVSICRESGEDIVCRLAADDRKAFEEQLDALSDRVAALEERIGDGAASDLPNEEEIDRAMGIMETFMRRFFGIIQDLNRDLGGTENGDTRT